MDTPVAHLDLRTGSAVVYMVKVPASSRSETVHHGDTNSLTAMEAVRREECTVRGSGKGMAEDRDAAVAAVAAAVAEAVVAVLSQRVSLAIAEDDAQGGSRRDNCRTAQGFAVDAMEAAVVGVLVVLGELWPRARQHRRCPTC